MPATGKGAVSGVPLRVLAPARAVLSRTLLLCFAITATIHLATIILGTVLPLHMVALGGTKTQVGLLFSVMTVVSMFLRPAVGGWIDRFGARPVIVPGAAILVGTSVAFHLAGTPAALIALMIGMGLANGLISTPASIVTAQASPPEHRGEALGTYYLATSIAIAIAPPIAFALFHAGGVALDFVVVSALAVVILILVVALPARPPAATGPAARFRLYSLHALPASGVLVLLTIGNSAIYAFVPLYALAHGQGGLLVWFFGVYSVWLIGCRALLRGVSDRIGRGRVLVPAMAALALGFFCLALPPRALPFIASAVLLATAASVLYPTLLALVVDRAPETERGLAMGTLSGAWDLGIVVGSVLIGAVVDHSSYTVGFVVAGISATLGLAAFLFVERRQADPVIAVPPSNRP